MAMTKNTPKTSQKINLWSTTLLPLGRSNSKSGECSVSVRALDARYAAGR